MVKSVKRSMDLVLQFLTSVNTATNGKFIVSGVSKRGWTSLLTTAVDSRVIANIPVVYDNININPVRNYKICSFILSIKLIRYVFVINKSALMLIIRVLAALIRLPFKTITFKMSL